MSTTSRQLVAKLWDYCDVLRDDGVSTIDYVEQLTYLLFLKMAHERSHRSLRPDLALRPVGDCWQTLLDSQGQDLENAYRDILVSLGTEPGTLGMIFRRAQNKIQDPAKLRRLVVELIDRERWSGATTDVKGDAYEELLAKSAEDIKSGAGQYFTPRALIAAMVECVQPGPDDTVYDPACGTGGFLLGAYDYLLHHHGAELTPGQRRDLVHGKICGTELVTGTARLAAMNLFLRGVGTAHGQPLIDVRDALARPYGGHPSVILANPPFGKRSSITVIGEDGRTGREDISYSRHDFWVTTTNKQLNFVQHIASALGVSGRAAVVLPDNVLFEGGAGETIRRRLLSEFDVHTMLRLPTGIFYAGGVKANVLFFDKRQARPGKPWTSTLWVYDFRVGQRFTLKQNPLRAEHLADFVACYQVGKPRDTRTETERFRPFSYDELVTRDKVNLDITWLRDPAADDDDSPMPPDVLAREIVDELQSALAEFAAVADVLAARAATRAE
ncbi:HsdM family class I SAM-dependent methyltransferase [Pseudofrankia asymbiotica]|uniref:site-specific DNA-methyltransferase (adenine-specific) n=1 Tax=Pseudofrankia asymbiotica TaxID=1834516 RepID=A0A1V2I2F9_9ACTN|nr:class I SAM-dependent DNA methyltransferase [Pseudofrankia asymbiotica]ONH23944.1 DNA methyltransferase [Pseudofrankia asymbiotica]